MDDWERKQAANKREERANADRHRRMERHARERALATAKKLRCALDCAGKVHCLGAVCECDVLRSQERLQASATQSMVDRGVG